MRVLATIAAVAGFASLLYWGLRQQARVECDVCITLHGRTECVAGQGESEALAVHAARTGACAVLGSGVTDSVKCSSMAPTSLRCREL
jgi:hypothetical protein